MGSTFVFLAIAAIALAVGVAVGVAWGRNLERQVLLQARAAGAASPGAKPRAGASAAGRAASAAASGAGGSGAPPADAAPSAEAPRAAPAPRPAARHGHAVTANGELALPASVGRYQLDAVLGRGAMGCVYRGHDPKAGRAIALKTLIPGTEGGSLSGDTQTDSARERFFREAETGGRLKHPGIVTIYDAGEVRGLAYIAMELLHGRDLSYRCASGALLPPAQVASLMAQVAEALGHAHDRKVVHRDIKPANLVWDEAAGSIKITDFGVARLIDTEATSAGLAIGTPAYMSPEQVRGEAVDGQSDIYALGATLFHLLTGRLPYVAEQMSALLYKVVNDPPPDPRTLRPDLPAPLAQAVVHAMAKKPQERPADARPLARELASIAADMGPASGGGGDDAFMRTTVAPLRGVGQPS